MGKYYPMFKHEQCTINQRLIVQLNGSQLISGNFNTALINNNNIYFRYTAISIIYIENLLVSVIIRLNWRVSAHWFSDDNSLFD